jgi:hypothetical protein
MQELAKAEKGAGTIDLKSDKRLPKVQAALAKRSMTPDLAQKWTVKLKKKSEVLVGWASDDLLEEGMPDRCSWSLFILEILSTTSKTMPQPDGRT